MIPRGIRLGRSAISVPSSCAAILISPINVQDRVLCTTLTSTVHVTHESSGNSNIMEHVAAKTSCSASDGTDEEMPGISVRFTLARFTVEFGIEPSTERQSVRSDKASKEPLRLHAELTIKRCPNMAIPNQRYRCFVGSTSHVFSIGIK